jgi:hypothetical protein
MIAHVSRNSVIHQKNDEGQVPDSHFKVKGSMRARLIHCEDEASSMLLLPFNRLSDGCTGAEAADEAVWAAAAGPEGGNGGAVALMVPQTARPGPAAALRASEAAGTALLAHHAVARAYGVSCESKDMQECARHSVEGLRGVSFANNATNVVCRQAGEMTLHCTLQGDVHCPSARI